MNESLETRRAYLLNQCPKWEPLTLQAALDQATSRYPESPFVITSSGTFTYAQMSTWVDRIAAGLLAHGAERGDHIALIIANYPEFVALKFAIARIGCIAVPMNYLLRKEEMGYIIRQSNCTMLVMMNAFRELDYMIAMDDLSPRWRERSAHEAFPKLRTIIVFDPTGAQVPDVPNLSQLDADGKGVDITRIRAAGRHVKPEDVSDIVYTSGTTGVPKGAMLTHDNVLVSSFASALVRGLGKGNRTMFALPLYHVFAYVEGLLAVMWVGGAVIPQPMFDPKITFTEIQEFGAHELLLVPTMTTALVESPERKRFDLSTLRGIMSAAAPAPIKLWNLVRDELGVTEIVTGYGQTEVSASTTYTMPEDPIELVTTTVGRAKPGGPAGRKELGVDPRLGPLVAQYKTVDPLTGSDLPEGAEGELAVRGPEVMRGYYNKPDETALALDAAGWFRSGDLGRISKTGYITLTGRSKELYKCGGELVAPKEIEELLSAREDVEQVYVVGMPDDRMGEIGCAFIVPRSGAHVDPDDIVRYCREHLARFKVPAHVVVIERSELPQTATGKIQKFRLRDRAAKAFQTD